MENGWTLFSLWVAVAFMALALAWFDGVFR